MQYDEKLRLLKAIPLLAHIPERNLANLSEFLKPREVAAGAAVFEEGSWGMSLYFISSGRIRVFKRGGAGAVKDLAFLGPGDFFGEMAIIDEVPRSAGATADGPCVLFELFRGDLSRWVKSYPQQAVQFFAELAQIQSRRLRRASNELTLHFDISNLLLEAGQTAPQYLARVLERIVAHLDGAWSAAAYLSEGSGAPAGLVASLGKGRFEELAQKAGADESAAGAWIDGTAFQVPLLGRGGALGRLLFCAQAPVAPAERDEIGRTLTTVSRPISIALEIIRLRAGS